MAVAAVILACASIVNLRGERCTIHVMLLLPSYSSDYDCMPAYHYVLQSYHGLLANSLVKIREPLCCSSRYSGRQVEAMAASRALEDWRLTHSK